MTARLRRLLPHFSVPLVWAVLSALLVFGARDKDFLALFGDTDDATRLVVVRDLMNGQNWFDHIQHRLNTPFGAEIHWSRLIDLPLALLIQTFDALAPGQGERLVLFVWPILLLLPALYLTVVLTRRLVGPNGDMTALIIAALSVPVLAEFAPGRIDHHSVQAILALWLAIETLGAPRRNGAAIRAGIAAATSLAIGAETLPIVAAAIVAFGLNWVIDPGFAPRLTRFGAAFAVATLAHFLIAVAPENWFAVQCDAMSVVTVAAAFAIATVFAVLARLSFTRKAWGTRFALGAAGAALVSALLLELFPTCAAGPFAALEPWLVTAWLDRVREAQPLWRTFSDLPAYALAVSLPVLIGFGIGLFRLIKARGAAVLSWLAYVLLLFAAILAFVLQVRGVRLAALLSVPGLSSLVLFLRRFYLAQGSARKLIAAFGLVSGWLVSCGFAVFVLASLILPPDRSDKGGAAVMQCLSTKGFAPLARLSPARIAAPVDLGPYLLLMTPHAVIGAPYHRNSAGIADSFRIFGASETEARAILRQRGIDFIVSCDALNAVAGGNIDAPDALAPRLKSGDLPDWLSALPVPEGALDIYRVAR